ncbi:LOW QUALITY PROTEIN: dynein heavy chain 9, axonemal [Lampris incognitus]|uniref:LOW QUALITY PROTEIN: dynein heavy chain 9, axonemal n=1 Tax=Lampris incognitus TaxID=2546036 RepID=UPI0024B4FBDE|nr:LOW QUALITY PROTEIN: dynein heavy chain 9, axonemal [Lampris incognitus]
MDPVPAEEDQRFTFIEDYVLSTLKLTQDRWQKCLSSEDDRQIIQEFLDKPDRVTLVVSVNAGGLPQPAAGFPASRGAKAAYFVKQRPTALTPDSLRRDVIYGDLSYAPLDQFAALVEEVVVPLLSNGRNHSEWPQVVSQDIRRHVHSLKTNVFVMSGQVKGKTLLPLPLGSERVEQAALERDKSGDLVDKSVIHAIESVVIEWSHQLCAVLKKDSSEALLEDHSPTPHTELLFWKNRHADLECIHSQLKSSKVTKMAVLLEAMESSYYPAFRNLQQDVLAALEEAKDICTYLRPLQHLFEDMENADFPDVKVQIAPLMHAICLVWANSRYYNTPARLIVLLQETCNLLMQQAHTYLSPEEILTGEISESLLKVRTSLETLQLFRTSYEERRANLDHYQKNGRSVKPWDFSSHMVFSGLDRFIRRVKTIEDILLTAVDLLKLEKMEFGGIKGRGLSQQIQWLHQDFLDTFKFFTEKLYDCLDLSNREFDEDVRGFKLKVDDTDRRLGAIFCQAFDDASGLENTFKVLDMFGSLLERPLVAADAQARYPLLVSMFDMELDGCKLLFNRHKQTAEELGYSQVDKNMPAIAGGLRWAQQLQGRIGAPFSKFRHVSYPCLESAEGCRAIQKYEEMMHLLERYSNSLYEMWAETVTERSQLNLSLPLISRDPATRLISVNFNPQLVSVLREVKYLEARRAQAIPDIAVQIYTTRGQLWQFVANLELTTGRYNKVMCSVLDVEYPLVHHQLRDIDIQLKQAEESLSWNSQGIWEFILETRDRVCDLESRLQRTKDNVEEIQSCMRSWAIPVFDRKEGRKDTLLSLEDRAERMDRFYGAIRSSGERVHFLLKSNLELFGAEPSSDEWKAYVEHIDDMVVDGCFNSIECSLRFLLDNTDQRAGVAPLFEVQLDLRVPDLVFNPSLEFGAGDGFYDLVESLVNDVYRMSSLVPRLAQHYPFPHYQADMEDMADLADMRQQLMERVQGVMATCCEFRDSLERFAYLYVDDRKEFMRQFLLYGHVLTSQEIGAHIEDGVPENPPTLDNFREQVDGYEYLYEEVQELEPLRVFLGWMRVDGRAFKSALLNIIKKWSFMFKQHLIQHVTTSLSDLDEFIVVAEAGLGQQVEEGDYGSLVRVMGHLLAVKERQSTTDAMFEPLQQTIALLKEYEQELPDMVYKQLEDLPEKWTNVKKLAVVVKQQVAPLQASEVASLRRRCASFEVEQYAFRESFRKHGPFRFDSENPFAMLDVSHRQIQGREAVMASLVESASLFEVTISDYKQLRQCRREVGQLKELWDMITAVESSMAAWKTTPWRDINVDDMELECKQFSRDILALDKEVRAWEAFTGLDSRMKNLLTSLRAVAELQNPAIRARHWHQLMATTGVRFTMDQETSLADLLQLNLHCFEDEVRGIVDKAVKEMGMEKVLSELNSTWTGMQFQYEPHHRTHVPLLQLDEDLIETLEDNQVQLQNLMSSKYIAHFLEEVSSWQRKLSVADSVISIWFEVQRTWIHLESIFIGSTDIRAQLPEDSKRFEGIDADFKELANAARKTPNVLEATNKPGLLGKLEDIQSRLSMCEKSLAEYLDTKRLAFPRFYFISSADLLDILSNGTNPHQVQKHLSKLFDNMVKMQFDTNTDGNPTKTGVGMYSKEEEYVPFNQPCDCTGQVEVWLNRVLDTMRSTVRHEMTEAVMAYEDKPREQWLFDYPAQVALTCTQIWWTSDVGMAFARLEEGYENTMKEYYRKQVSQLNTLISMLIGQLSPGDRQKVMTICTIDVHARDVVAKIIAQKVENSQAFVWLSQLRHRWDEKEGHCFANICDAQFLYSYEYLGNTPRLVITPLTDRCYITLTQSLHLTMSGAPAGPAGTGKTETTKDLGRALGIMVYVFNCSEQMDYKSCGNIYKGLAQTGAWGCFDEFNRISVEVLSVVAVQVKSIQDAIRDKKRRFNFMGEEVDLSPSVGIFITMNPGYAGRTELPENLKALFRPCAMVVPDLELICEIMLVAEGFIDARILARKFITLYTLCKELLSKQDHYDWGLRAIKSVLVVAGSLKRGDPERAEDQVLMRALRDFNIPKIVTDDMPVFMGLIGDLFPSLDVPRKRDMEFEKHVKESVLDLKLQAEDNFVLKVVQLEELLAVRHSVFVVGNAGTGKSQVMRSLQRTYQNMKRRPVWTDLNPKAVTNDELFGIINPTTREWKDGLFSSIMRELANLNHNGPKWIVLDGDIDPMWIESLNTVMDDNKVLTLASNERITLNHTMRLVFEISHLRTATPATVSRAGILYINPADLGWNPPVSSWIDRREVQSEKANLTILFDKYIPSCLDTMRSRFKMIIPIPEQSMVQMLCYLLECLLTPENTPPDCAKELYELYFVFAAIWAFGGAMFQDQLVDYRVEFSKWWLTEFKTIKFPSQGTVFDYYIDPETKKFELWSKMVPSFEMDADTPLQACLVHTAETIRVRYFMDRLLERRRPVMLVGNAGTGKSVLFWDKLGSLHPEKYMIKNVPFNYYTTSAMLQVVLEKPLEKKAGRNYGPPGNRRLVYFIDDMNMPELDAYGTVQPHTLIRQHMDYNHWYDRSKLLLKEVHNVQYVSCMNPTAGSFTINPRLQRHFSVFALSFPGAEALITIYTSILTQHLRKGGFSTAVEKSCLTLVQLALALHHRLAACFLPTAVKFHYIFNLRDLSNIFQGILFCSRECLKSPMDLLKIYLHESNRVYRDKLVEERDFQAFDKLQEDTVKKFYEDIEETLEQTREMNLYCHFACGLGETRYMAVESWNSLSKTLVEVLDRYNEVNAALNLVLFEDAMAHICRINRILESPQGNALLVGVGGSGKQSLTRLAAFISNLEVFQITLRKGYGIPDLKSDLASLYVKAGVKNVGTVLLMTDAQVANEKFLILVNDLLASGEIPDLFPDDEVENILAAVRTEVRGVGLMDTRENCWKFFIDRVRRQLKDPEFQPDLVASKSYAAAGLCSWVLNIVKFYQVYCEVEPKRQALNKANAELATAQEKLTTIKTKINLLNENLAKLTAKFEKATAEKLKCQQEAESTARTISLANRLVGGLASENVRWAEAVENFRRQERTLCGDVLLITAFVSYLGYFTKRYRLQLMDNTWKPYLSQLKVPIPVTPDLDPLTMLMDDADIAAWQNEGLPADRMSTENATILTSCQRWPLMVDPQLQGMKWIKNKYGEDLCVIRIGQRGYLDAIERALEAGDVVLIENLEETVDPVLGPLLGRETIKKGRYIKIGEKECEYNPNFRLILHTKLASPHYQPELQAQCTLMNFTVTRDGLEDQLLAAVVSMERPDLEELKSDLTKQQNSFKITLKTLEDNLLSRLSSASGNFLGDTELVENLETTKRTAAEIEEKVKEAKVTEAKINEAREHYRPAAARASLLYFIMNDLNKIHPMYQFSLKAFSVVFQKAVLKAQPDETLKQRVSNLIDSITSSVFQYTTRGLFECDKLTYLAQLVFQILLMNKELNPAELDFVLRYPVQPGSTSPVDFLSNHSWGGIKSLCCMEEFRNLDRDIEGSAKRWKKFLESECPEKEKFPQEWKSKTSLQRLCMMRAMRPDRMTYAVRDFVEEKLGSKYVIGRSLDFAVSFEESSPATPMFFILSPGVDPLKDVEKHGKKLGYTFDNHNLHNVSLGQGQEVVAEQALDIAAKEGHWVILQNIHLVAQWLGSLEKHLEQHGEGSHHNFRVFISAEPSSTPEGHIIPQGILENSIKITNEPPTGMHANLHKALDNFNQDTLEMCARENEFKSILFALCYFHAVVAERRKFGPQGWNRSYPFNTGDLTISINVLYNYLEANAKVPYDDLRYLFGEIMYGGHITDDWDRRLCRTYLEEFIRPEMMEGELHLAPGFPLPGNMDYHSYHQYIDDALPAESPYLYGLHPNAEIGFLTQISEKLFRTVLELQPRNGGAGEGSGATREEKVHVVLEEIMEKLPEEFNMVELLCKAEERTPYQVVALQECERMNLLTQEIRRSLLELNLGLKGELTMTSDMENLQSSIFLDLVPDSWTKRAYPSTSGLALWFTDLLVRIKELEAWTTDFLLPSAVWLSGFFNPQSFLTAIMQAMARRNEWPLDRMCLQCDVTKKNREDFSSPPREGAYIHGLYMEGARWDTQVGMIVEARLKELTPTMPVIFIKAIPVDKQEMRNVYQCPVYKTCQRGPTYVWTFNLKTKENPSKWTLAGVALLLQT